MVRQQTNSARKKRSKTGCLTCRQRKVRCDEQHPTCKACRRLGLACSYSRDSTAAFILQKYSRVLPSDAQSNSSSGSGLNPEASRLSNPNASFGTSDAPSTSYDDSMAWWSSMGEGLLNANYFEHLSEEQGRIFDDDYQTAPQSSPSLSETTNAPLNQITVHQNVTVQLEDREVLRHFTTTMVRFCILRNWVQEDNLYNHILINMALFHRSLFDAMLAWSALHLAHIQKRSNHNAKQRYERAFSGLIEDLGRRIDPNYLLATIWFLMQYQLILAEGVEGFCELIDLAAEVAGTEFRGEDPESSMHRIGPIGSIILVWMSARDSQAAYLGLGGRLLGCLRTYPRIYDLVETSSAWKDSGSPTSFTMKKQGPDSQISDMQICIKLSFRNVSVAGQIKCLGRSPGKMRDDSAWATIRRNLGILRFEIERDKAPASRAALGVALGNRAAMPAVDPLHYNRLLLLAGYYTTIIQYHDHHLGPTSPGDQMLSSEECANRIIRLCQRVETATPNSPQGIWPTQILIAGIKTQDPIYQAWAISAFRKAECWGAHIVKTRKLLEAAIERQNMTSTKVDLIDVMKSTTGFFIF